MNAGGTGETGPTALCRLDEIPDGTARGFRVTDARGRERRLLVVRRGETVQAYVNSCPHRGTPLDLRPDDFFDAEGRHLVCATHGAVFRPEDGLCVAGPCAGEGLEPVPAGVRDGRVVLLPARDDSAAAGW